MTAVNSDVLHHCWRYLSSRALTMNTRLEFVCFRIETRQQSVGLHICRDHSFILGLALGSAGGCRDDVALSWPQSASDHAETPRANWLQNGYELFSVDASPLHPGDARGWKFSTRERVYLLHNHSSNCFFLFRKYYCYCFLLRTSIYYYYCLHYSSSRK